jgi:hypothetical protein
VTTSLGATFSVRSARMKNRRAVAESRNLAGLAEHSATAAETVLRNARRALRTMSGRIRGRLRRAIDELVTTIARARQVVAQTRRRLAGDLPDSATRLVSLHDPDARPIAKGRIGKPVEFGYKAQIVDNEDGLVLDYDVREGNRPTRRNWPRRSSGSPAGSASHPAQPPPTVATARPKSSSSFMTSASKPLPYPEKANPARPAASTNTGPASANSSSGAPAAKAASATSNTATAGTAAAWPAAAAPPLNRPGVDGGSEPTKGWSHASTEEVSKRAA